MEHPRISRDPAVMAGKACIRGTRVTVEHLLREVSSGAPLAEIAEAYELETEDVVAAIRYAADFLGHESLIAA